MGTSRQSTLVLTNMSVWKSRANNVRSLEREMYSIKTEPGSRQPVMKLCCGVVDNNGELSSSDIDMIHRCIDMM